MKMSKGMMIMVLLILSMVFSPFVIADGGPAPGVEKWYEPSNNNPVIQGTFTANYKLDGKNNPIGYRALVELCMPILQADKSVKDVCQQFTFHHNIITPNKWFNKFTEKELIKAYRYYVMDQGVLKKFGYDENKYQGVLTQVHVTNTHGTMGDYEQGWATGKVKIHIVPIK